MFTYEYFCDACGARFEVKKPMNKAASPESCPDCGAKARKLFSPVGFTWGWECWDYENGGMGNGRVKDQMVLRHRD